MNPIEAALANRPQWMDDGICAQTDPAAFYPEVGESTLPAKQICSLCPVKTECLRYAIDHQERFGIWGGTSELERRKLRRVRPKAPYVPPTPEQVDQVYMLAATGLSRPKIAETVGVSMWTVKNLTRATRGEAA